MLVVPEKGLLMTGRSFLRLSLALFFVALPVFADIDDLLSLVPAEAVSVGAVRLDELRGGALLERLFEETSDAASDGEARMFMEEAGLDPRRDVDRLVVAMIPRGAGDSELDVLVLFEGSFDRTRLSSAVARRGAQPRSAGGELYYRIHDDSGDPECGMDRAASVAFVSNRLVIAGTEAATIRALDAHARGGTRFLAASNIGRDLREIDRTASAWVMIDVPRSSRAGRGFGWSDAAAAPLQQAMRHVSTLGIWASERNGHLEVGGVALVADPETRALLEDLLRGVTAAWRMAAREKNADWLPVIRKFDIDRNGQRVRIRGRIPISMLREGEERLASR
jgi:hypothetical protein